MNYRVLVRVLATSTSSPLCKNAENALAPLDNVLIYRHSRDGPLQHLNTIFHRLKEMVAFELLLLKVLCGERRKLDMGLAGYVVGGRN